MLSQEFKDLLRQLTYKAQNEARAQHADNPEALRQIDELTGVLYDTELDLFETYYQPLLAQVHRETLESAQAGINAEVAANGPLTKTTVIRVENPYV